MLQIIILAGLGLLAMLSEVFNFKKIMPFITFFGVGTVIAITLFLWNQDAFWPNNMLVEDIFNKSFVLISSTVFLLWILVFRNVFSDEVHVVEYLALTCFAMVGGYMMLSYSHLVMLFLGVEILSIPVYVLAGSNRKSLKSNEAAFKYFLMGAFASCFLLLGITFVYGATGTFDIFEIAKVAQSNPQNLPVFFFIGAVCMLIAMLFKISAAPFHFWTPDVYEGAPTPFTAFMSTLVKIFATAASFKLFIVIIGNAMVDKLMIVMAIVAISMLLGNILGAFQKNPKRILAYSSIGHAGFMLLTILIAGGLGFQALLYYSITYSIASLLAFYVLHLALPVNDTEVKLSDLNGLGKRNPWLGFGLTVAVLSMAACCFCAINGF